MGFRTILVPIEQHELMHSTLPTALPRAPSRSGACAVSVGFFM
jgi:hypothetical protein